MRKWEDKIVQLEPGTITLAQHRTGRVCKNEMEIIRKHRMEKDDKITTNKVETLNSRVLARKLSA